MKKVLTATEINLPRDFKSKSPIYQHEGLFYIKANKPNTRSNKPFHFDGVEYSEVTKINEHWFSK